MTQPTALMEKEKQSKHKQPASAYPHPYPYGGYYPYFQYAMPSTGWPASEHSRAALAAYGGWPTGTSYTTAPIRATSYPLPALATTKPVESTSEVKTEVVQPAKATSAPGKVVPAASVLAKESESRKQPAEPAPTREVSKRRSIRKQAAIEAAAPSQAASKDVVKQKAGESNKTDKLTPTAKQQPEPSTTVAKTPSSKQATRKKPSYTAKNEDSIPTIIPKTRRSAKCTPLGERPSKRTRQTIATDNNGKSSSGIKESSAVVENLIAAKSSDSGSSCSSVVAVKTGEKSNPQAEAKAERGRAIKPRFVAKESKKVGEGKSSNAKDTRQAETVEPKSFDDAEFGAKIILNSQVMGFVLLSSEATFADARKAVVADLVPDSIPEGLEWRFYISSWGSGMSLPQEAKLKIVSFLERFGGAPVDPRTPFVLEVCEKPTPCIRLSI